MDDVSILVLLAFDAGVDLMSRLVEQEQAERARSEADAAEVRAQKAEAEAAAERG